MQNLVRIFITLLLVLSLWSSALPASMKEQVTEARLRNGMKAIIMENQKAPQVTLMIVYRVGSRNEQFGKTGLSHMLEHMMFKGTERVGPEEFSRIIQENGGQANAFTTADFTAYFETLSSDRLDIAMDLESDRMTNILLREPDFLTERSVVMEERRLRTDDNPQAVLYEQLCAIAFQEQPYRWPVIGWMEDIKSYTIADVKEYHRRFYPPANAFIIVAGDVKAKEVLPKLEHYFGSIPRGNHPGQRAFRDPPRIGERRVIVRKEAQLPAVLVAYHVPNLEERDSYVLEVIASLLSSGESSRLYRSLVRDKGLALAVDADHSLLSKDPNLFVLSADVLPGKEPGEVERVLETEIEKLQKELVPERELEKTKNQREAAFVFGQDSLFYQALLIAQYEVVADWRAIDDYVGRIRAVTAEDIRRVAAKYFVSENRSVATLVPLPPKEGKAPPAVGPSGRERVIR